MRLHLRFRSLRQYILFLFIATVVVVNTVFFMLYFFVSVARIKQEAEDYVTSVGKPVAFNLSSLIESNNETQMKVVLASLFSNRFIDGVALFNRDGRFIYGEGDGLKKNSSIVKELIKEGKLLSVKWLGKELYFAFPIYGSNYYNSVVKDLQAVLLVKANVNTFLRDSENLIFSVLVINLLISAFLIVFFMMILRRYVFDPLTKLRVATDSISGGDYVEIKDRGRFEFKDIFESFNRMSNNLDFYTTRLEILNRNLTGEVEKRTRELELLRIRFQDIAESVGDILWETDGNFDFVFCSAGVESVLGYTEEEIVGKPFSFSFEPACRASMEMMLENIKDTRTSFTFECRNITKGGKVIILRISGKPFFDGKGKFLGFRGVSKDVTRENELQRSLQRIQRIDSLGTLVSGIAHDFNNIINVIQNFADLLIKLFPDGRSKEISFLKEIRKAAYRGSSLIRKLLIFTRKSTVRKVKIDPGEQFRNLKGFLSRILGKNIKIKLEVEEGSCFVLMDPTEFDQVMVNLAINARDAMPNGGEINIKVYSREINNPDSIEALYTNIERGMYCIVEFKDTGKGIPTEILEKIFEPFYTTKPRGTGLGLSIVFAILRQIGGTISVESEEGKGTRFILYLPAIRGKGNASSEINERVVDLKGGYKIVVIDDDAQSLRAIEEMLKELRCSVVTRGSCRGISRVLKDEVDLFIVDLEMPTVKGEECIKKILQIRPGARILVVSGFLTDSRLKDTIRLGAIGYLEKPFGLNDLAGKLSEILESERK